MRIFLVIAFIAAVFPGAMPALAADPAALARYSPAEKIMLRDVVRAAEAGDRTRAEALARGPVTQEIARWMRLFADEDVTFDEARAWLKTHEGWPGAGTIRRHGEGRIPETASAATVIGFFGGDAPRTLPGATALAQALRRSGQGAQADAVLRRAWVERNGRPSDERAFVRLWRGVIGGHHMQRLDRLLWDGNVSAARRMLDRLPAGARRLAAARIALLSDEGGVDRLIDRLSAAQRADPGLAHARMLWREGRGLRAGAEEIMLAASPGRLGEPGAWARKRREFARDALEAGDAPRAYALARDHGLTGGTDFAATEWLAGWIALRHLNRPAVALGHFRVLEEGVNFPISKARAAYWAERTRLAMRLPEKAAFWHERAIAHPQTFYGQQSLADRGASRPLPLSRPVLASPPAVPDDLARLLRVGFGLWEGGRHSDARRFIGAAARRIENPALLVALGDAALSIDAQALALIFGKQAARRGAMAPRLVFPAHPVSRVPGACGENRPDAALIRAVMRQESAFDPQARSPRDARGLMQVLPGTARETARAVGLGYSGASRLTDDPAYNMTLGACYLTGLLDRFGGDRVLAIAAYNAGPGRVVQWLDRFGDPRGMSAPARIDWIESVPFGETRSYIQRVLEARAVYVALR